MSNLDDPRVAEISGGYEVSTKRQGPTKVLWDDDGWAVFANAPGPSDDVLRNGMWNFKSPMLESALEEALR